MQAFLYTSSNIVEVNLFLRLFVMYLRAVSVGGIYAWNSAAVDYSLTISVTDFFPRLRNLISRREDFGILALEVFLDDVGLLPEKVFRWDARSCGVTFSPVDCNDFSLSLSYPGRHYTHISTYSSYTALSSGYRSSTRQLFVPYFPQFDGYCSLFTPDHDYLVRGVSDTFTQRLRFPCWDFSFTDFPTPSCLFSADPYTAPTTLLSSVKGCCPEFFVHLFLSGSLWASFGQLFATYYGDGCRLVRNLYCFESLLTHDLVRFTTQLFIDHVLDTFLPYVPVTYHLEFAHNFNHRQQ